MGKFDSLKDLIPTRASVALLAGMMGATPNALAQENAFDEFGNNPNGSPTEVVKPEEREFSFEKIMKGIDCKMGMTFNDTEPITDIQLLQIVKCEEMQDVKFEVIESGKIYELVITLKGGNTVKVKAMISIADYIHEYLLNKGVDTSVLTHGDGAVDSVASFLKTSVIVIGSILLLIFAGPSLVDGAKYLIGRKKKKEKYLPIQTYPDVHFDDIAGLGHVKKDLLKLVQEIQNRTAIEEVGGSIPKGILFTGTPGTGKTLAAKAVATEANIAFISVSGSELTDRWLGGSTKFIESLFEQARKVAEKEGSCIIFIDEIDAIGSKRSSNDDSAAARDLNTAVNQLLTAIDGFDGSEGIVVIGATNHPDNLDPALIRPGRLGDRQIEFTLPDQAGRLELLRLLSKNINLAPGVRLETLAATLAGHSGADVENVLSEAVLLSIYRGDNPPVVTQEDLTKALNQFLFGIESDLSLSPVEKTRCATHEAGHAVMAFLDPGSTLERVSIVPRGRSLGSTLTPPFAERLLMTRTDLEWQLKVLLAGRFAEMIELGQGSTGAEDDLLRATQLATQMVVSWGMAPSDVEGICNSRAYRDPQNGDWMSPGVENAIDKLLDQCAIDANELLTENRALLKAIAARLVEKDTLEHDELMRLFEEHAAASTGAS